MSTRDHLGGIIHTYQKYDPVEFPSPTAPPPDLVSPAFDHLLYYGSMRRLTEEELARAIHLDPRQIRGLGPSLEALMEMHMGDWEGMTTPEITEAWPDLMKQIYEDGVDLPRGASGESWGQLTLRVAEALAKLDHGDEGPTLAVAHGGAIRSYISSLTTTTDTHAESFFTPANTSVTHVAVTDRGPEILDFSVATHLESLTLDSRA